MGLLFIGVIKGDTRNLDNGSYFLGERGSWVLGNPQNSRPRGLGLGLRA